MDQIQRSVESRQQDGVAARAVLSERQYQSSIDDIWAAIVQPTRLQRWFLAVTGELCEGGSYQLEGNAGGTILRCEAPRLLALTWEMQGGISWVNVALSESHPESTALKIEHIALEDDEYLNFWDQFGPGAVGVGWDLALFGLADYLVAGDSYNPPDETDWMANGTGRQVTQVSSDAWIAASIAFGTDEGAALGVGNRAFAFYVGDAAS